MNFRPLLLAALIFATQPAAALVILQYHHVSEQTPKATSVSPALFAAHLQFLAEQKFKVIPITQLRGLLSKGPLPDRTAIITFDDGYLSVYKEAFPRLKQRGWPFAVFVNTQAHDQHSPQFMTWAQLREMSESGATIANHSDSHPHLIRQQAYEDFDQWQARREREILFAEQRIAREIGASHKLFAYPFGEYDLRLQKLLAARGFLAFGQQSGPVADYSSAQLIPRFAFGGDYGDMADFATKVTSLALPQARVKVSDNSGKVLDDPELPADIGRPVLRIASPLMAYLKGLACYASGQGQIKAEIRGNMLVAQATRDLPSGRSRYNCTAQAGGGRFYWHSQLFIRRLRDGSWYNE